MTEGAANDEGRGSRVNWRVLTATAVLMGMAIVGVWACETVAQITFSDRSFRTIQTVDVTPQSSGGQCADLGAISDGQATMRVVFFDNDNEGPKPIKPGEHVEGAPAVGPTRSDADFSGAKLYSIPDILCEGDAECGPMICEDPDPDDAGVDDRCMLENINISVDDDPRFVGEEHESQAIAVAMSNFGRWRGFFPDDFSGVHIFDPEGSNPSLPSGTVGEVAVDGDETRYRFSALRDMASDFGTLVDYVEEQNREAHFGFWTFGETRGEVLSEVEGPNPTDGLWTTSPAVASAATSNLGDPQQGRSSIYLAMQEVLHQGFVGNSDVEDADHRTMVFLVSGYDEGREYDHEGRENTIQDIIDDANEHDVEVSIIQVDTPREVDFLRDDPRYYRDQHGCSDDSECANFETCREPTWYTQDPSTNNEDDVWRPRPDDRGQTFCLPHYEPDENGEGQVGPIADYQRIACETGGAYTYVPTAGRSLIHNPLEAQIWSGEGAWEIDFTIDDFHRIDPTDDGAGQPYLLEAALNMTIGQPNTVRFEHDTRRALFTPGN